MRPLRLRLGGFTCFRDEQDIDFAGLELFAIAGPTGAGKTSLLDAMVFALYGEVPRVGAQGLSELIALGHDRAFAVLDFAIGAGRYRIARRIRRQGPTATQLEQLADAGAQPIAEGVRDVDQHVRRLLGIDASTFLKAVILPQGRFADFLKSKPAARRAMLRSLLQLEVYERMRARAEQLARTAEHEVTMLRRRLADDFADATPARLAELDRRLAELVTELAAAATTADRAHSALEDLERTDRLRRELAAAHARYAELERSRSAIADGERRIACSERARPLLAILDTCAADEARHASARAALAALAPLAEHALHRHRAAVDELARAQASAAEAAELAIQLARLDEAAPLLARRADCERLAAEARAGHAAACRDLAASIADGARAGDLAAHCRAELTALEERLARSDLDPGQLGRLAAALGPAAEVSARCRDLARAEAHMAALDTACAAATAELARAGRTMQDAVAREAAADERHARAATALEASRQAHAAQHLRSTLVPGALCPVCQQRVAAPPPAGASPDLSAATRDERAADRDRQRCAATAQDARVARELAEQAHAASLSARDRHASDLVAIAHDRDASARRLAELARDLARDPVSVLDLVTLAAAVPTLHAEALARAEQHAQLDRQRTDRATRLVALSSEAELLAQRTHRAESERERAARDVATADSDRAALDARIQAISPSGDPRRDRAELAARSARLARQHDDATRAELSARAEREHRLTELAVARTACATAEAIASASAARTGRALFDAGFQGPDEARAAVLDDDRRDAIARQVRTWHDDLASTRGRVADLAQPAGDRDVTPAELDTARAAACLARDHHTALLVEQGRLGSQRGELAARIARAAGLHDQLAQHRTTHRIYDQLAGDLRTDQFQAHLLEGTFRDIVHGASLRLHELSGGRYRLDYAGDDFFVIDGDNARERRRADTLSGGETFLASLALALQLSEHIQRTAGAVRLDSLFIDEGFGTLDPETLATVGDAIQELSRHHRMVGIITHVQELTASLPARIQVSRGPRGSGVEIVLEA